MDEGPEAMDGSAPQTHAYVPARTGSRRGKFGWLWTAGSLAVVIAAGVAIRLVAGPQAVAQAPQPGGNAGPARLAPPTPAARQAMPTAAPANQPVTAPRQAPALSGVQPAG